MAETLAERSETVNQEYLPSVRVIITQAVSLDELRQQVLSQKDSLYKIELSRSHWITNGPDSPDPFKVFAVGGKTTSDDEDIAAQKLCVDLSMIEVEQVPQATLQVATCRTVQDEVHLYGIRFDQVTPIYQRDYSFHYGNNKRREHWFHVRAPVTFCPHIFYQEDNILAVHSLSPKAVHKMFEYNGFREAKKDYPLIESLSTDPSVRQQAGVTCSQEIVEQTRTAILRTIDREEIAMRLSLLKEIMFHCSHQSIYGQPAHREEQLQRWNQFLSLTEDPERFNQAYRGFLADLEENFVVSSTPDREQKRQKNAAFRTEFLKAWHRVLFKAEALHCGNLPIQGELLAARLSLEDMATDELEFLEEWGPQYVFRLSSFLDHALTPNFSPGNVYTHKKVDEIIGLARVTKENLQVLPQTAEERYQRLEWYRRLKLEFGSLHETERELFHIWQQHIDQAMEFILGMTAEDFAKASVAYNFYNQDVQRNIAPRVAKTTRAVHQLSRQHDTEVSQPDELMLMLYGYNPKRLEPRGFAITPKTVVDARLKWFELPLIDRAIKYYYPAIRRSTFFWRRILDEITGNESRPRGRQHVLYMENADSASLLRELENFEEELASFDETAQQYVICYDTQLGQRRAHVYPAAETEKSGILVYHRKTILSHDGVPIYFFERTRDKSIYSLIRKMLERGRSPETILDVYGTAIVLDTVSIEVRDALHKAYEKSDHSMSFDLFVEEWAKLAIRTTLYLGFDHSAEEFNYHFDDKDEKDCLDRGQPTGGSAASAGGYREIKYYASVIPKRTRHDRFDSPEEEEKIEVTIYPDIEEYLLKIFGNGTVLGDEEYALLRRGVVTPGFGKYSLESLEYPDDVYPFYDEIAAFQARRTSNNSASHLQDWLERLLGPIHVTLFRR